MNNLTMIWLLNVFAAILKSFSRQWVHYVKHGTAFIRLLDGVFPSLEWVQIIKSVLSNFAVIRVLPFLNNPKDLDPSYKMDLNFWDCFGRKKHCLISEEIRYAYLQYVSNSHAKFWLDLGGDDKKKKKKHL